MYQPPHFRIEDQAAIHDVIRAHPLGLLITHGAGGILADSVPFLLKAEGSVRLVAHVARANPQVAEIGAGADALVVFQAENAYVSPGWYETKRQTGKVVPTWNYVVVQAHGRAVLRDDPHWLRAQVTALTEAHEAGRSDPWAVSDAPDAFIASQLRAIVGIEIAVAKFEGKFKMSQNRPEEDRRGVVAGLASEVAAAARSMSERIKKQG